MPIESGPVALVMTQLGLDFGTASPVDRGSCTAGRVVLFQQGALQNAHYILQSLVRKAG